MNANCLETFEELRDAYIQAREFMDIEDEFVQDIIDRVECLLKDDKTELTTVAKAVLFFPQLYRKLPHGLMSNQQIVLNALVGDKRNLQFVSEELKFSRAFQEEVFFAQPSCDIDFNFIAEDKRLTKKLIEKIIENEYFFKFAPPILINDKSFYYQAVAKNGMVLHFLPWQFKDDVELTRLALQQCGIALKYVHPKFQSDIDMVLIAVGQTTSAISYAHPSVFSDKRLDFLWEEPAWAAFKSKQIELLEKGLINPLGLWL